MRIVCVTGGRLADRHAATTRLSADRGLHLSPPLPASRWPFERHLLPTAVPDRPCAVLVPDLHLAFPAGQTPGTRLVLTQSTYQLQRWLDWLASHPQVTLVAHASRSALRSAAAEAFARRGPWHAVEFLELEGDEEGTHAEVEPPVGELLEAFAIPAIARLERFRAAGEREPGNPAIQLAVSSVHMELDQLQPAQDALDRARALAPDWEAVEFEYGKLWLRADDLERAAERFAAAVNLMPTFAAALSNLGAALGETDRPDQAVDALKQALQYDPNGYTILNNLSVLCREQGRLDEAIDAARQVTDLAPAFVFGYYNLAHALFLQGRFAEARDTYEEGHRRDPQKNPVQGCRLAVARAAAGDTRGALDAFGTFVDALTPETRADVLGEAEEVLDALLALPGASASGLQQVLDVVREKKGTGP